jgi:hypothetical protein
MQRKTAPSQSRPRPSFLLLSLQRFGTTPSSPRLRAQSGFSERTRSRCRGRQHRRSTRPRVASLDVPGASTAPIGHRRPSVWARMPLRAKRKAVRSLRTGWQWPHRIVSRDGCRSKKKQDGGPAHRASDNPSSSVKVPLHVPPEPPTSMGTHGRHNQYVSTLVPLDHSAGTYRLGRPSVSLIEAVGDISGPRVSSQCQPWLAIGRFFHALQKPACDLA